MTPDVPSMPEPAGWGLTRALGAGAQELAGSARVVARLAAAPGTEGPVGRALGRALSDCAGELTALAHRVDALNAVGVWTVRAGSRGPVLG